MSPFPEPPKPAIEDRDRLMAEITAAADQFDRGEGKPFEADRILAEIARRPTLAGK